jgi:exodeoxyribonuclease III
MRIATWNVNSIKVRQEAVCGWLASAEPDVLLLQELKCVDEAFPREAITALGYAIETVGQKAYNGVAILSRLPMQVTQRRLPGDDADEQARYLEAVINGVRIASLYLPNGNPAPGDKFTYKLGWMDRLNHHAADLLRLEEPVVLGGDYNIIPAPEDCWDTREWLEDALFLPESRGRFHALLHQGWTEAFRACDPSPGRYSYWDYQKGRWSRDEGIRIDHLLLSPQAADRLQGCTIDRAPRAEDKASDHTPVIVTLS